MFFKEIDNAFDQRVFWAHDHHIDMIVFDKFGERLKVVGFDGNVLPHSRRTGIAGRHIERFTLWALYQFPSQRMFATA